MAIGLSLKTNNFEPFKNAIIELCKNKKYRKLRTRAFD